MYREIYDFDLMSHGSKRLGNTNMAIESVC